MKINLLYERAKAKSYKAQKECFKLVLRLQENGA